MTWPSEHLSAPPHRPWRPSGAGRLRRFSPRSVLSAALVVASLVPGPAAAQLPDSLAGRIDAFVEGAMGELDLIPGLSLAVVRGDEIVYEAGFGWSDVARREPATPETVYYLASLSKALTGMGAAVLASEGRLDLDAPITRYFPGLDFPPPLTEATATTVRDLLRHTARFRNSGVNFYTTFVGRYEEDDLVRVLSEYSDSSEGFAYSNTNYALASEILERAGGAPWQDVLDREVFDRVGMPSTTAYASRLPIRGVATPYIRTEDGFQPQPPLKTDPKITGAGGFFSSAHDLARYVVANLNEGRVGGRQALPAAAVREVQRPQTTLSVRFFEFDRRAYGLGLYLAAYGDERLVHHFGGIPGGFRSHMSFMPRHGIGVVVLQNTGGAAGDFPHIVATYVYDLLTGRPDVERRARQRLDELVANAPERVSALTSQAARIDSVAGAGHTPALHRSAYLGAYRNPRLGTVRVRPGVDGLRVDWGEIDGPMVPLGGNDFLVRWQPGYPPSTWSFVVSEGRVERFEWGTRPFVRIGTAGGSR